MATRTETLQYLCDMLKKRQQTVIAYKEIVTEGKGKNPAQNRNFAYQVWSIKDMSPAQDAMRKYAVYVDDAIAFGTTASGHQFEAVSPTAFTGEIIEQFAKSVQDVLKRRAKVMKMKLKYPTLADFVC